MAITQINWRGSWDSTDTYAIGDLVYYNGTCYVATDINTGIAPDPTINQMYWSVFSVIGNQPFNGMVWGGNWAAGNNYLPNVVVQYSGATYVSVSRNGNLNQVPGTSLKFWMLLASNVGQSGPSGQGLLWRGDWVYAAAYSAYDTVFYNGATYLCIQSDTGVVAPNINPHFSLFAAQGAQGVVGEPGQGLEWRNQWNPEAMYNSYDCVGYSGSSYICIANAITGVTPGTDPSKWNPLAIAGSGGSGGGGSVTLETNGIMNGSQTQLNLVAGTNITLSDDGDGNTTVTADQINANWTAVSGSSQILNKPVLATVATSGSYSDLHGLPTIPAAQVQSDWNETTTTAPDFIKNKPVIPISTSQLANNSGYIAASGAPVQSVAGKTGDVTLVESDIANLTTNLAATEKTTNKGVAYGYAALDATGKVPSQQLPTMGSGNATSIAGIVVSEISVSDGSVLTYVAANNDIEFKPVPPEQVNSDWNASTGLAQILNKPSIPTETSQLTNNSGFITASGAPVQSVAGRTGAVVLAEGDITNLTADLAGKVGATTTVNGHALSSNVTVSASDLTTGTLPHAQLPTLLSGDIPNNAANTSGSSGSCTGNAATATNVAWSGLTGTPPAGYNFVENETPGGTPNNVLVTFTLAHTPVTGSVRLYWNGSRQLYGATLTGSVQFTVSGNTITVATTPSTGDILIADYRF